MRVKLAVLALGAIGAVSIATVATGQSDDVVKPESARLVSAGQAALDRGQAAVAYESYEAAAAVDPKNRAAFIGMARSAQALGLPGKAIKFYREALQLDPNDLTALQGQGEALLQRGAKARAQANLERIRKLCNGECAPATRLASAIAKAPAVATAAATPPVPPTAAKN